MEPCEVSFGIYTVSGKKKEGSPLTRLRMCWDGRRVFKTLMVSSAPGG
jgi:hypothetical protein